ncbi:hypothetical protein HOLleu_04930 [Holothuria leucospilota]|uniref:G-protein coupled receptors family 1 profile domain-containing protein n=1 Tax=Holothuria leucospilota TaxID=206669 RepID=A0A9Q1HE71_HOLLE|nr:hypothetical protein HOLleu_04930 [Holothuria leucospilota]
MTLLTAATQYTKQAACKCFAYATLTFGILSLVSSGAVAFDRYVAVCRPYSKRLSVRASFIISVVCSIGSTLLAVPISFNVDISPAEYDFVTCATTKAHGSVVPLLIEVPIYAIIFLSLTSTIICYTLVWRSIRNHKRVGNVASSKTFTGNQDLDQVTMAIQTLSSSNRTRQSDNVNLSTRIHSVMNVLASADKRQNEGAISSSDTKTGTEKGLPLGNILKDEKVFLASSTLNLKQHFHQSRSMHSPSKHCMKDITYDKARLPGQRSNVTCEKREELKRALPGRKPTTPDVRMAVQGTIDMSVYVCFPLLPVALDFLTVAGLRHFPPKLRIVKAVFIKVV